MIDGRYSSLGLAIFRGLQAPPDHPAFKGMPVHAWLLNGIKALKPYLEEQLHIMEKDLQNWGPEVAKGREMNEDQLKEEIRWVRDAVDRIMEMEKEKAYSRFHEVEIEKYENRDK